MTKPDPSIDPITDVDLALFAEGLLSTERCEQVKRFLSDHPELAVFSGLWSQSGGDVEADIAQDSIHVDATSSLQKPPQPTHWLRRYAAGWKVPAAVGAAAVVGISVWGVAEARAIESTLSRTEIVLQTESSGHSTEVTTSQIALENLTGGFWLSRGNSQRRDRLLAAIYLNQAQLEMGHYNQMEYAEVSSTFPPLSLSNQAIDLVRPHAATDDDSRQVLIDAYQLRGQIQYLFGTFMRTPERLPQGVMQKSLAADSLLAALEIMPSADSHSAQRLQLSSLLFKTLHKGGLAGQLADESGKMQPAESMLIPRIRNLFSELADSTPTDKLSIDQLNQFVDDLGDVLMQLPVSTTAQTVAMMDICNSCGLRQSNGRGTLEESVATFSKGLQMAESIAAVEAGEVYQSTRGRLLGNMADAYRNFNQLDQELPWRRQAIAVFGKASQQYRAEELFLELGWVTSAQLIAEYRWQQRHPEQAGNVKYLLGALRHNSNDLASLNGYQMGEAYWDCIYAIQAEDKNDFSLGRGATAILALAKELSQLPENSAVRLSQWDHWSDVLRDFQGNAYFQQLPEFQQVWDMYFGGKPAK